MDPIVDRLKAEAEWPNFKQLMFLKRRQHRDRCDVQLLKAKSKEEKEQINKKKSKFGPHKLFESLTGDATSEQIFPECSKLLLFLLLFPLSTACVERLFSKMKLVQTRLRNYLAQSTLENLLFIATECPADGFSDEVFDSFVDELKRRNPQMRVDV